MRTRNQNSKDMNEQQKKNDKKSRGKPVPAKAPKKSGRDQSSDDDSDSIDSHGNIRGLIAYTDEESSEEQVRRPRKAALKARRKIKKELAQSEVSPKQPSEATTTTSDSINTDDAQFIQQLKKIWKTNMDTTAANVTSPRKRHTSHVSESSDDYENELVENNTTSSESESESESDASFKEFRKSAHKKRNRKQLRSKVEAEDDSEDADDSEDTDDSEDADDSDSTDGDYEDDDTQSATQRDNSCLFISLGGDEDNDRFVPKRYNLKKEPKSVRKFVKLITAPMEDNTIDTQIDQFKELTPKKQEDLLQALEKRPTMTDTGVNLMLRILTLTLPHDVQASILAKYNSMQSLDPSSGEYFKLRNWLDKVVSVPFGLYRDLPVKLEDGQEACGAFMKNARAALDSAVYGQEESKLQVLQFISTKIANPTNCGTSLLLTGPPGIGKTTIVKNGIASALGWPFQFISLGGDSDASTYTGHQLVYESSHCGKIVNSLIQAKSMSCVILFDEVDKISTTPKGEEIHNMLIHLTDPQSNNIFEDKYLAGVPIDLSKVMFIFSANDIEKIDKVLLDRLTVIHLKGYDLKQKVNIAEKYLLPAALKNVNLVEKLDISRDILTYIIENYASEEDGVRQLKRCIEQITQKVNMLRMYNAPELPFYIKDFHLPFVMKKEHVDLFITKRAVSEAPPMGMYM